MGSGKTTLGSTLARKMDYEFVDMDQNIEETAAMTVPDIFSKHGEKVFRKWEHDTLLELCRRDQVVIATGGGAPCHGDMMSIMNANGITLYIHLPPLVLKDRLLQSSTNRPLIRGKSEEELLEFISTLLKQRETYYNKASFILDGDKLNTDHLTGILKKALLKN